MEINQILLIARRWWWLLVVGAIIGTGIGYGIAMRQTPIYRANTRVIASRATMQSVSGGSTTGSEIYYVSEQVLMATFLELLKSPNIFNKVSQTLGYTVSSGQVSAGQVGQTRILNISAEDTDPQRAADIANAIVVALIEQNDEIENGRFKFQNENLDAQIKQVEDQIAFYQTTLDNQSSVTLSEQLAQVQAQMEPLQAEIIQIQKDIAILTPARTLAEKSKLVELEGRLNQIEPLVELYQNIYTNLVVVGSSGVSSNTDAATARIESTLALYQEIYINLIDTREQIRLASLQNAQSVNQIEIATAPTKPIRPQPTTNGLMGGGIGLALAAGIIFLIEYLDDTLKAPEDVERTLGLPLIGYIADMSDKGDSEGTVYVSKHPRSPASEAFRSLRTNLEFAAVDKPLRTILVTGAEAGDGKTTIAANLAAIFAQGGKRVMLLDCDLRRPRTHRFFGLQNRVGMTDIFRDSLSISSAVQQWTNSNSVSMSVITSGSLPPNPAELLGSQKMEQILKEATGLVDVVVIDSPPSVVADAQVLSAKVDGVLLVIQPGKTHKAAAKATLEQIDRAGARIIGVVYNRISRQSGHYYYGGYRYYSPYNSNNNKYLNHDDDTSPEEDETNTIKADRKSSRQSMLGKIFNRSKNKNKVKNPV